MEGFDGRYTFVAYDAPFNHSAQCNIGAGAANTDVVVMLNNDAWFHDGQALEEMGAWALVPDVATVGVRIEDEDGRLISAGLRYRRHTDASYSSPMEESADAWLARCAREASGNTFAAVAVESGKLERLGWLDAVWFPNGFNDVEFCLRARKQGYTHMYLGHLAAVHLKGRSRGASDEVRHTLRLREQYPCASGWALAQLELETRRQPARFPGRRIHSLLERVPSR
jgi:GT2 family glycosyltransferase